MTLLGSAFKTSVMNCRRNLEPLDRSMDISGFVILYTLIHNLYCNLNIISSFLISLYADATISYGVLIYICCCFHFH